MGQIYLKKLKIDIRTIKMAKTILITGASTGLGRELAEYLSQKDLCVYAGTRHQDKSDNPNIHFITLDVNSDKDCEQAIKTIIKEQNRIDVVINNAGVTLKGLSLDFDSTDLLDVINTNLVGSFRIIKASATHLKASKGRVINVTSINGFVSMPNFGLYCASKFGLEALGMALRYELGPGIKLTNVVPGAIRKVSDISNKGDDKNTARVKFPILKWLLPMANSRQYCQAIYELLESESAPAHVFVGFDAWVLYWLMKILPYTIFDKLMNFIWQRK